MTQVAFEHSMRRLTGLKFAPVVMTTHYEALRDLTDVELDAAITRAARECDEFPSPKMLRMFVDEYRGQLPVPDEDLTREKPAEPRTITTPYGETYTFNREWRYYCEECSDTGRRSYMCGDGPSSRYPWLTVVRCQTPHCEKTRRGMVYEHEWVTACPCAATNPAVLRKKAQAAQVTRKQANG